ncbi:hypothetical protein ACQEVC_36795 [Plantactinospora sp. CA-294935]|uniref:hypothetical protein n=1 Tax=Plantactinospora sp. CA-294935 TaxID=3240012 RepID=UPI003D8C3ED5
MADQLNRHGQDLLDGDRMPETFEVDRVDHIADILLGVATAKGLIGHGFLARRMDTGPDFLSQPLDQVSRRAFDQGEPLCSALVVSRSTDRPSSGFYGLTSKMRPEHASLSDDELWEQERKRC